MIHVSVQLEDFDSFSELARLEQLGGGAVSSFIGLVRASTDASCALELETYHAMAQAALHGIANDAVARWPLLGTTIIHRFGILPVGKRIIFVGVASAHRVAALEATAFLIDWTKTKAPFWKREWSAGGSRAWVDASAADTVRAMSWERAR